MTVSKVTNVLEQERFDNIWIPSWQEQGYEIESHITPGLERYIFSGKGYDYGTIEFVPYKNVSEWPINKTFPFNEFIQLKDRKVIEVDKLTVSKECRGSLRGLYEIINFITTYAFKNSIDYYIILINPDLYDVLIWRFKLPMKRLMKPGLSELPYYPAIIDVEDVRKSEYYIRYQKRTEKKILVNEA